mgnify:FL=1
MAALWEMAEEEKIGFEIAMGSISLKQETVEICEYYRLNPYQLTSAGSYLILTDEADQVIEVLERRGASRQAWGCQSAECAGDHKQRRDKISGQTCAG